MARKTIKKDQNDSSPSAARTAHEQAQQFPASGDTIVDEDVVMHEDLGYARPQGPRTYQLDENLDTNAVSQSSTADRPSSVETVTPDSSGGLEILGREVRELVQAIQNLRHIGIEDLVLPLPKIVVVGDQSTGKSSLIEGISGIKVPRKVGLCTRCPLDINLSESKPGDLWICHVSLHKKYVYEGSQGRLSTIRGPVRTNEGATRARPLGPWIAQDAEDTPFATTTDKDQVAELLEWAQTATLNPGSSPDLYQPCSPNFNGDRTNQVKFSPNVVRLDIRGPNLPNLSFYDLPGVINVSDIAEEEYLVNLVKNLVKEYIKDEKCINLLTLTMTDDPANSSASKLIRDMRAESRTVGVLTKPDRVQSAESLEQWVQILDGDKFKLGHDYYIVMNNPDVQVDHATARAQERQFFQVNEPWATQLKNYERRFGTLRLQTALSTKLTAQIRLSLPRITEQVLEKAQQVKARLDQIPEPPVGNLARQIHEKLFIFELETNKQLDGGDPEYPFRKEWNALVQDFRKVLADSRPLLFQTDPAPRARSGIEMGTPTPIHRNNHHPITIDSDDEEEAANMTPLPDRTNSSKRRIKAETPRISVSKRPRMSEIPLFTPEKTQSKAPYSKGFNLNEIRRILHEAHVGLPGQTDPKAIDRMICMSIEVWIGPLDHFLDSTIDLCQSMLATQVVKVFSQWQGTPLYSDAGEICKSFLEEARGRLRMTVHKILKWETYKPVTYNEEMMRMMCGVALTSLRDKRREYRAYKLLNDQDASSPKTPNRSLLTDKEKLAKATDAQLGPDPFDQEVEAMSTVRGYYECAFSRFVDIVSQAISYELFTTCRADIGNLLKEKLGLTDTEADEQERCSILLAIDPEKERERLRLKKEKETLEKAQSWLKGLIENEPTATLANDLE